MPCPAGMWRIALYASEAQVAGFEAALDDGAIAVSNFESGEGWTVEALTATEPDAAALEVRVMVAAAALGVAFTPGACQRSPAPAPRLHRQGSPPRSDDSPDLTNGRPVLNAPVQRLSTQLGCRITARQNTGSKVQPSSSKSPQIFRSSRSILGLTRSARLRLT
ncbi:MAG: hypothetical protein IH827_07420 [Myxococcales bacterium]|nr:hypothetical protein [Myxococcales bacterium]